VAGAVGDDLAGRDLLVQLHQGPLVDGGVLVGAPELLDPVPVVLVQPGERLLPGAVPFPPASTMISSAVRDVGDQLRRAHDDRARVPAHFSSSPGQTTAASAGRGAARSAAACSSPSARGSRRRLRNGISAAAMRDELLGRPRHEVDPVGRQQRVVVVRFRHSTSLSTNEPSASSCAFAWARPV
jgi:hypothetical protein